MNMYREKFKKCSYNGRVFTGLLGPLPDCSVDLLAEKSGLKTWSVESEMR